MQFIANVASRKRFKEIYLFLHFDDKSLMKEINDQGHYRAFKIQPAFNHFNNRFWKAQLPTSHQSIDEHIIKFKGHDVFGQYV